MPSKRPLLRNILALLIGLLLIVALEGVLRIVGVQPYGMIARTRIRDASVLTARGDPKAPPGGVYQSPGAPVFTLRTTEAGERQYFCSRKSSGIVINTQHFPAHKDPSVCRIFCFGGSTVQGFPYFENSTSFARWMQEFLNRECTPGKFEVINAGVLGMDSFGILEIASECLNYEPDVFVVVCGHNELHRVAYTTGLVCFKSSRTLHRLRLFLTKELRIYSALASVVSKIVGENRGINRPLELLLPDITIEEKRLREQLLQLEFGFNLQEIVDMTRKAGVGLILGAPCPNFRDYVEPGWRFGAGVGKEEQFALMVEFFDALLKMQKGDLNSCSQALQRLLAKLQFSPFHYWLGRCYEEMGDVGRAKEEYSMSLETSRAGARMTRGLRDEMRNVAERNSMPFVDFLPLFEAQSPNGIVGRSLMLDNCHPNVRGHQVMAKAILEEGIASGLVKSDCRLDRFDELVSEFTEEDLSWLPDSTAQEQLKNWPQPMEEITISGYAANIAEWLADYLREKDQAQAIDWLQKAADLAPDKKSIADKLAALKQAPSASSSAVH